MTKSSNPRQGGPLGAVGLGAGLLVLFILSGRWSLSRVLNADLGALAEPRLFIVAALAAIAFSPGMPTARDPRLREASNRILIVILAFYSYMAISFAWAPEGADVLKAMELGLVLVSVAATVRLAGAVGSSDFAALIWWWFVPVLSLFAVLGLAASAADSGRLAVLGGGPNVFGRNMGMLCVAMLSVVVRRGAGGAAVWAAVAAALVLLSGSRGALVATVVGGIAVIYFNLGRVTRLVYVGAALLAASVLLVQFTDFGSNAVEMFRFRVLELGVVDRYDGGRMPLYLRGWDLAMSAPIFGIGLGGFAVRGILDYPHNLFLEAFCEGGVVGLSLLVLLLALPCRAFIVRRIGPGAREYATFALVLASAQFSGDFYDSRAVFIFGVLVVLMDRGSERPTGGTVDSAVLRSHHAAGRAGRAV